jgi:hypothetical protein
MRSSERVITGDIVREVVSGANATPAVIAEALWRRFCQLEARGDLVSAFGAVRRVLGDQGYPREIRDALATHVALVMQPERRR